MCCFFLVLLFFGPRLAFLIYWLLLPARVNYVFHTFIWPLLGLIFLPWTTLMYVVVYPIYGFDWFLIFLAVAADIVTYGGGAYGRKQQMTTTTTTEPGTGL